MKIAFDLVCTNKNSGSLTYITNLLEGVKKRPPKKKIYIFMNENIFNLYCNLINRSKNIKIIKVSDIYTLSFFKIIWIQIILPMRLKRNKIKKLYSPLNICPLINKHLKIKTILALHSNLPWTNFDLMPGNFIKKKIIKYFMEKSLEKCDQIISISKSSQKELQKNLKFKLKKKIRCIHLSLSEKFNIKSNNFFLKNINYKKDYILTISSCAKYHNILNLIKAFNDLKTEYQLNIKYYLVLTILDKDYFKEINSYIFQKNLNSDVKIIINVEPKYLINLYGKAKVYVYSSYSEAFGYTSLEAMKMNCPVAISNHPSSYEINGNAALYFNPDDINDIANKLNMIIKNKKIIKKLKNNGKKQIKKYSPGEHTEKLLELIQS